MLKSITNSALTITLGLAITFENQGASTLDLAQVLEASVTTDAHIALWSNPSVLITSHGTNWIKAEDHRFDGTDTGNCIVKTDMTYPYFTEGKTSWNDIQIIKDYSNTHDYDAFRIYQENDWSFARV